LKNIIFGLPNIWDFLIVQYNIILTITNIKSNSFFIIYMMKIEKIEKSVNSLTHNFSTENMISPTPLDKGGVRKDGGIFLFRCP
jgi:hypothetical protein